MRFRRELRHRVLHQTTAGGNLRYVGLAGRALLFRPLPEGLREEREFFSNSNKLNLKHFSNFKYHDRWDYFKKILKLNLTKPERIVRLYFSMSYYILRRMNYEERFSLIFLFDKLLQSNLNPAIQKKNSLDGLPVTFLNELIYFQC